MMCMWLSKESEIKTVRQGGIIKWLIEDFLKKCWFVYSLNVLINPEHIYFRVKSVHLNERKKKELG